MTKLTELDATFVRHISDGNYDEVTTIEEANGVIFDCPKCGRHSILVWDRSIPRHIEPGPGRTTMTGTSLEDLTLDPSIDLSQSEVGCKWHGFVKQGNVT